MFVAFIHMWVLLAKIPVGNSIASMHFCGKLCVELPARIFINGSITKPLLSHNSLYTLMIGVFISSGVQLDIIKWVVWAIISLQIHRDREQIKQHVFSITSPIWNLWYGFCWPSLGGFYGINNNLMAKEPQKNLQDRWRIGTGFWRWKLMAKITNFNWMFMQLITMMTRVFINSPINQESNIACRFQWHINNWNISLFVFHPFVIKTNGVSPVV